MRYISFVILLLINLSVCSQSKQGVVGERYVVQVNALDYAFGIPEVIPSGWITFKMINRGKDTHVAYIGKKADSLSLEEFKQGINKRSYWPNATPMGGPGLHSPGKESETTIFLEPGHYYMACGANKPDGTKHSELGMIRYFEVSNKRAGVKEPQPDGVLILDKYSIEAQHFHKGGEKTMKVVHKAYPMDIHLVGLHDKSTISEAERYFMEVKDPTHAEMFGGAEQAEPGRTTYMTFNIEPGEYAWMSQEYSVWGMKEVFKVNREGSVTVSPQPEEVPNKLNVDLKNQQLELKGALKEGKTLLSFALENKDHTIFIERLKPEMSLEDYRNYWSKVKQIYNKPEDQQDFSQLPTVPNLGEYIKIDEQSEGEVLLDMVPGRYIISCFKDFTKDSSHFPEEKSLIFRIKD